VAEIVYSNAREGLFHQDEIGTELLDIANDYGADMLIMGAYSHNRLGQQVLGGTTRTILDNMNLPVMMCH
jgi:nucleotide-binding universal stress UspA family protein